MCPSTRKQLQYKYSVQPTDFIKIMPRMCTQWPREMQGKYSIWYSIVMYCTLDFTDNFLVASFLPSVLTASQNSLTYQSSASTQGLNYKLKPQYTFTINRNNCVIRWAARAAETEVCFFSEFLKALFQVYLDSLSVCDC